MYLYWYYCVVLLALATNPTPGLRFGRYLVLCKCRRKTWTAHHRSALAVHSSRPHLCTHHDERNEGSPPMAPCSAQNCSGAYCSLPYNTMITTSTTTSFRPFRYSADIRVRVSFYTVRLGLCERRMHACRKDRDIVYPVTKQTPFERDWHGWPRCGTMKRT